MISLVFSRIKQVANWILNYSIFVIYRYERAGEVSEQGFDDYELCEIGQEELVDSPIPAIKEQSWYGGDDAQIYACIMNERVVSVCAYWYGERYMKRNFWPLKQDEAKLVQLFTAPEARGKGIAQRLIQYSSQQMMLRGFKGLYARVWHSNYPSRKAFEKSHWATIATIIEIQPIKSLKPIRIRFNRKG